MLLAVGTAASVEVVPTAYAGWGSPWLGYPWGPFGWWDGPGWGIDSSWYAPAGYPNRGAVTVDDPKPMVFSDLEGVSLKSNIRPESPGTNAALKQAYEKLFQTKGTPKYD